MSFKSCDKDRRGAVFNALERGIDMVQYCESQHNAKTLSLVPVLYLISRVNLHTTPSRNMLQEAETGVPILKGDG